MSGSSYEALVLDELAFGHQPVIDCIHFWEDRCAHPSSQRGILPNKRCVFTNNDPRCTGCRFQVRHERKGPPGEK